MDFCKTTQYERKSILTEAFWFAIFTKEKAWINRVSRTAGISKRWCW